LIRERQSCKTGVGEEVTNAEKYLLSGIAYYISTSLFSLFMTIFSQSLFTFMGSNFMTLSFFSARHIL